MRRLAPLLTLCAAAALAGGGDPAGTIILDLEVGKTAPLKTVSGSNVICDDLRVVVPEFAADGSGFILRGLAPGSTLCGVWMAGAVGGGLYRVKVAPSPDAGPPDAGIADAGPTGAGIADAGMAEADIADAGSADAGSAR